MKKWVCGVCGYVFEGENPPEKCPQCKAPASAFSEKKEGMGWACEHVIGVAKDVDERVLEGLRANFTGECTEVGMYLAMSRQAIREALSISRLRTRKPSTPLNLRSFWARLFIPIRRKIFSSEWKLKPALPKVSSR